MNAKRAYRSPRPGPTYLYEVKVRSGTKTYTLARGQLVSVHARTNLPGGKYEFIYAERDSVTTELFLYVERRGMRKMIHESDIKQVHIKTERRG